MAIQYSIVHRSNAMATLNTDIGNAASVTIFTGSLPSNAGAANSGTALVTFTGNTPFGYSELTSTNGGMSSLQITGTAGQISFTLSAGAATVATGMGVLISGTFGGSGSISGYNSAGTLYFIVATNGTTTATLSTTQGGSGVTTTAGTPTGLTYTLMYGVLYANAIGNANATASGTAGYFRIFNTTNTNSCVVQGTCGTSGADMILTNTNIATGQTCTITSITVTAYGA